MTATFKERWESLLYDVDRAAALSGRKGSDIQIIAVSKYASLLQMEEAYLAGVRAFGESRLQVGLSKQRSLVHCSDIEWHFIGTIQSNKATAIACNFSCIHSVSSIKIARKLSEYGIKQKGKISCFIEVNPLKEKAKQGLFLEELDQIEEELLSLEGLHILGLMAMGPHTQDKEIIRDCFRMVTKKAQNSPFFMGTQYLSMGMSQDFSIAIEEGATHIRIGSLLYS